MSLPLDLRAWPEPARAMYEENAGRLQFECRQPRARAEAEAERLTRAWYAKGGDEWVKSLPPVAGARDRLIPNADPVKRRTATQRNR